MREVTGGFFITDRRPLGRFFLHRRIRGWSLLDWESWWAGDESLATINAWLQLGSLDDVTFPFLFCEFMIWWQDLCLEVPVSKQGK